MADQLRVSRGLALLVALCGQAGSLRLLKASTAARGAGTSWAPPPPGYVALHPLAKRVALGGASRQMAAAELQMLKTDVRMAEQIRLVICGLEELVRHGAGRQRSADTGVGARLMTNSMGKAEPASQRVGYPRCPWSCRVSCLVLRRQFWQSRDWSGSTRSPLNAELCGGGIGLIRQGKP